MTVFASSVLDNFNRAPVNPLAPNWATWGQGTRMFIWASRPNVVLMDEGISTPTFYAMAYTGAGAAWTDSEAYITATELGSSNARIGVLLRCGNIASTTGATCCYARVVTGATYSQSQLQVGIGSGGVLQSASATSSATFTLNVGDKVGCRVYDVAGLRMVEGWFNGTDTGGVWKRLVAFGDLSMSIPASGYAGMYATTNIGGQIWTGDDFGAGSISVPSYTVNSDAFPVATGALASPAAFSGAWPSRLAQYAQVDRNWAFPASARPSRLAAYVEGRALSSGVPLPGATPPSAGGISVF